MSDNVNGFVPHSYSNGQESGGFEDLGPEVRYSPLNGLIGAPVDAPEPGPSENAAESAESTLGELSETDAATLPVEPEGGSADVVESVVAPEAIRDEAAVASAEPVDEAAPVSEDVAVDPELTADPETSVEASDPMLEDAAPTNLEPVAEAEAGPVAELTDAADEPELQVEALGEADGSDVAVPANQDPDPSQPLPVGRPPSPLELDAQIESLLFVADGPAPVGKLAEALEVKVNEVEAALAILDERYLGRGIAIQRIKDKVQLTTAPTAATLIQRFLGLSATAPLSKAALETLAIIAYRQPITRPQIEQVRGVNSDSVIKNLLTKGLVEEAGIAEGPGRPVLYVTTPEFLQHFGLSTLSELPELNLGDARRSFAAEILKG